ncbi:MAG: PAS domain-containing protein, partial [Brevefilum sp.]
MTTGTQNNQAEQLTHKKYQVYFQNSPIGIAILDEQGNFVETNPAFVDHLESHNRQVVNCHYTEVVEGQMGEKLRSLFEILIKNKLPYAKDVLSIKTSGDNHRIFEVTLSKFYDTGDQSFKTMLFSEDITQQKDT